MIDKQRIRTFILGGAVGALVGIILAPRSGRELRGSIAERAGEARDRGRENYFETQERLRERLAELGEGDTGRPVGREEVSLGPEVTSDQEPSAESGAESGAQRPRFRGLRDVSRETREDAPAEPQAGPQAGSTEQFEDGEIMGDRSEELRRKIRETRERLKRRTEDPGDGQA